MDEKNDELLDEEKRNELSMAGVFSTIPADDTNVASELTACGIDPYKLFDNRYKIIAIIGKGDRGFVFYVVDTIVQNGRYALKVIYPDIAKNTTLLERISRSVDICKFLSHKNIVGILNHSYIEDSVWYYTMDYVAGYSLAHILSSDKCVEIDYPRTVYILSELASALAYAHKQNIVHRDIKPSNIIIDRKGIVRLTDFSLAKSLEEKDGLSSTGELVGSPLYMAPEISKGSKDFIKCDIYSFGILAFEMATGVCPFRADNLVALGRMHATQSLPNFTGRAKSYPRWFYKFVQKCTEKKPEKRFGSFGEIAKLLCEKVLTMDPGLYVKSEKSRLEAFRFSISEEELQTGYRRGFYK